MSDFFTPLDKNGKRLEFDMKNVKILEGTLFMRKLGLQAIVEIKGKKYKVYGRACSSPHCHCDAQIKEI